MRFFVGLCVVLAADKNVSLQELLKIASRCTACNGNAHLAQATVSDKDDIDRPVVKRRRVVFLTIVQQRLGQFGCRLVLYGVREPVHVRHARANATDLDARVCNNRLGNLLRSKRLRRVTSAQCKLRCAHFFTFSASVDKNAPNQVFIEINFLLQQ